MAIEGLNHQANTPYIRQSQKNDKQPSIPRELEISGKVTGTAAGGLAAVMAGLEEIRKNLEKKLRTARQHVSQGLLELLGAEDAESMEEPGGMKIVARGLREVWKNLQTKLGLS